MSSQNNKKEINSFIDTLSIQNEEKIGEGENITLLN